MSEPSVAVADLTDELSVKTVCRFLCGDRLAILTIARGGGALGIGALFVLSAALAREYDGADLLAEPWHLVVPFAASLGTSFLLFCLLFAVGKARRMGSVPFGRTYLRFLGLYWMTAPLAWLYAIPVESFMTPPDATLANLGLLGVVSLWRVCLITRVVQCLSTAGAAAWPVVLLFADVVALAALQVMPMPVIVVMGGIRQTDAEITLAMATLLVGIVCFLSLPIWLFSTALIALAGERWEFTLRGSRQPPQPTRRLRLLAAGSVAAWLFVLPATQTQQRLARRVDNDLKAGRIKEALAEMAKHGRSDFPARWEPPPRVGRGGKGPPILDVMEVVVAMDLPSWVRSTFTEKFDKTLSISLFSPGHVSDEDFQRYMQLLLKLPEGPSFAARERAWLRMARDEPGQSEARKADLEALLELAESHDPKRHPTERLARPH